MKGLLDGFVPVLWHVYRTDHTGRGSQVSTRDLICKEQAEIALLGIKERERMRPLSPTLNPNPTFYLVAEDAHGQRVPYYGPLLRLPAHLTRVLVGC